MEPDSPPSQHTVVCTRTKFSPGNIPSLLRAVKQKGEWWCVVWQWANGVSHCGHPVKKKTTTKTMLLSVDTRESQDLFSLPDFVHVWALLIQVQDHGCVDVEVKNRISPVSKSWQTRLEIFTFTHYTFTFFKHLICSLMLFVSWPLHGVFVSSRHHRTTFLVVRSQRGCRLHRFSCLQLPPVTVVWSEFVTEQTQTSWHQW